MTAAHLVSPLRPPARNAAPHPRPPPVATCYARHGSLWEHTDLPALPFGRKR